MSQRLLDHIPKRMHSKIALVCSYVPTKQQMKVLVLTTDRWLFELGHKYIIHELDLTGSVLKDLNLLPYSFDEHRTDLNPSNISQRIESERENIKFGKYISYCGSDKRLFLLVQAFDKLVVIERTTSGFKLVKEYTNVEHFEIVDPDGNYQPSVAIHFFNISTPTFETFINALKDVRPTTSKSVMEGNFRIALERITEAKTELTVQQISTKKQFISLKDKLMFGPDILRSDVIEEKQQLGKYGDIWMKVVGDFLVIGIPVINNCSRRLTILQNVRAAVICENKDNIDYECDIYQLKDDSYTYDNLDDLMNSVEQNMELTFKKEWIPIQNKILRPETSAVVTIKTKLDSFLDATVHSLQYHCFLLYDIFNESCNIESFQQYYVKTIEVDTSILCSPEYQISFDPYTTYKDLLAISVTSNLFCWTIESKSDSIVGKLTMCLINTFGFTRLVCKDSRDDVTGDRMDVDANFSALSSSNNILPEATAKRPNSEMFYYRPTGHNHLMGTLIRTESKQNGLHLKVYVREDYKALYIYSQLYREFGEEYRIHPISYDWNDCYQKTNLLNFYESLQKEIEMAIDNLNSVGSEEKMKKRSEMCESQIELYTQELKTDRILMKLNRC